VTFDERVAALKGEGFTGRQAAFLVTVMLHAGVCMVRQYCAFAGIAHGHNAREFFARLVERRIATAYTSAHRQARLYHLHHRRLNTAIGEPHSRFRKPLPVARAIERLMMLDAVLEQPSLLWLATEQDKWTHFMRAFGTALTVEWLPQLRFGAPPAVTVRYSRPASHRRGRGRAGVHVPVPRHETIDNRPACVPATARRPAAHHPAMDDARAAATAPARCTRDVPLGLSAGTRCSHPPAPRGRTALVVRARRAQGEARALAEEDAQRCAKAARRFARPRYQALYRPWCMLGDYVVDSAMSPVLPDAIERGTGRFECEVLARPYLHLSTLVGTA